MPLTVNQNIDGNTIKRKIGDDSFFALVYEVENGKHKIPIVLKLFNRNGDVEAEKRFRQENAILTKLSPHARIIQPHSAVTVNGSHIYYLMELADFSLGYYRKNNEIDINDIKSFMTAICEGIKHAHDNTIAHRDLYWNNVLLKINGTIKEVKISDFGMAKDFDLENLSSIPDSVWGARVIKPPEFHFRIWDDPKVTEYIPGDIYALGVLFRFLFDGDSYAHSLFLEAEILTFLQNKNIDKMTTPEKDRKNAYQEWLQGKTNFFTNLQISHSDLDIMKRANDILQKLCHPDYTKRYQKIDEIIKDINNL